MKWMTKNKTAVFLKQASILLQDYQWVPLGLSSFLQNRPVQNKTSRNTKTICSAERVLTASSGRVYHRSVPACSTLALPAASSPPLHCPSARHCRRTHDAPATHCNSQLCPQQQFSLRAWMT